MRKGPHGNNTNVRRSTGRQVDRTQAGRQQYHHGRYYQIDISLAGGGKRNRYLAYEFSNQISVTFPLSGE